MIGRQSGIEGGNRMNEVAGGRDARSMLEVMMTVRAYEEGNRARAAGGNFPGTCTSLGQEAAAVGVVSALRADDLILTNHRSAGHLLARGADPGRMLAEVMGRADGYCKGKSGNLHISVKDLGVILTSTIVGGELSLATGFGDGAACEGVFHESLNLAATWNLPILYVCENNEWQAFVARRETMRTARISERASAYGMEGESVDGNDVEAVFDAATRAIARIRKTGAPFLLETLTYRMAGHYEPDDQSYVNPEELASWRAKDPIDRLRKKLVAAGAMSLADAEAMQARVGETIAAAFELASKSPFPDPSELLTDVYAEGEV
jgi:TPP-dependent pyruvate/acetoin dehydrogenase alpha subunit